MKLFRKISLAACLSTLPFMTFAWGTNGHRISGEIASRYLTPKAAAAVKSILGNESIAMASNWADFIKSDENYKYLSTWHYVDFDKPMSQADMIGYLEKDTEVDAYTKMKFMIAELKKPSTTKENKLLYLRMLIHIVEDVHQPFHTGHKDDQGGNGFKVTWFAKPSNLHSVWDTELIEFQNLSYTEYVSWINFTTPAQVAQLQKQPISTWLYESSQIAEKLYTDVKPDEVLNYKYNFNHVDILNQQLLKGGVRLAGVLNDIFGR
ncbi:S1/P1 nuclease [Mucilaginibacter myungsuensis]|uniref:S1/P1 nuclease n=1 Tax=Mucilaginibacter myungsuensis TaxID=649104 RepID=A0A929KXF1_9SPHI|nr:S1/P1 nuclease [Mucilaginibacter myungsuensis]MBE9663414.1 S1/P1 nuclease [Mucilaginibacter myungsuensis]MDN3600150.1 S1/P1 nuclease [Mucilaginibacter myungsuensis]